MVTITSTLIRTTITAMTTSKETITPMTTRKETITTIRAIIVRAITEIRNRHYKLIFPIFSFYER